MPQLVIAHVQNDSRKLIYGRCVDLEENEHNEFKDITSSRPIESIANTADEYAVAFLNSAGGSIFWGIQDNRIIKGLQLPPDDRDRLRRVICEKLNQITPHIDPTEWYLQFHSVTDASHRDSFVVELSVPSRNSSDPYFTGSGELFVRLNGVKQKLKGPQITEWIKNRTIAKKIAPENNGFFTNLFGSRKKSEVSQVDVVAKRFVQIFEDHGVLTSRIPRFIPQLTLDKFRSNGTLLPALTPEVLQKTINLFGLNRAWLEGVENEIYEYRWCYKSPERFFKELGNINDYNHGHPVVAFCCAEQLEMETDYDQPIALVLCEHLLRFEEDDIYRFRVFRDEMNWGYWKCRWQMKAMARLVYKVFQSSVPLYLVTPKQMDEIRSGTVVPRKYLRSNRLHDLCMEDFALSRSESAVSKQEQELPKVLEYIGIKDLDSLARQTLRSQK